MFIDAVCIKGKAPHPFSCSVMVNENEDGRTFTPFDLSDYYVRFCVLGAPTADAKVLVEKIITTASDYDHIGAITDAANGQFTFTINEDDMDVLGLGKFPISLDIYEAQNNTRVVSLTEGEVQGEFSKIQVVQV